MPQLAFVLLLAMLICSMVALAFSSSPELSLVKTNNKRTTIVRIEPNASLRKLCSYSNKSFELANVQSLNYHKLSANGELAVFSSVRERVTYVYKWNSTSETFQILQTLPPLFPQVTWDGFYHDVDISANGTAIIIAQRSFFPQVNDASFGIYVWNAGTQLYELEFQGPSYPKATSISPKLNADGTVALVGVPEDKSGVAYVFVRNAANATWGQQAALRIKGKQPIGEQVALSPQGQDAMACTEVSCYVFSMQPGTRQWRLSSKGLSIHSSLTFGFTDDGNHVVGSYFKKGDARPTLAVRRRIRNKGKWILLQNIDNAILVGFVKQNATTKSKMLVLTANGKALVNLARNAKGYWVQGTSFVSGTAGRTNIAFMKRTKVDRTEQRMTSIQTTLTLASTQGNALIQHLEVTSDSFVDGTISSRTQMESWDCPDGLYA